MDQIEKFFADHKDALDTLVPEPESWIHIDTALGASPRERRFARMRWLSLAATLIVAVGIGWFLVNELGETEESQTYALDVGDPFPEIELRNPGGELQGLSELKGKVVLVEFWASYSKVCTEENCYYFQPLYEQYRDQGFEIYGVSVDTSAQHWLAGIERDELPWIQVADIGQAVPEIHKQFPVEELPTTFLLDQEGHIIAKNVRAQELAAHLERMFPVM